MNSEQMLKAARQSVRDDRAKLYRQARNAIKSLRKYDPARSDMLRADLRVAIAKVQRIFPRHGVTGKRHRVIDAYPRTPTTPTVKCCNCGDAFPNKRTAEASICEGRN